MTEGERIDIINWLCGVYFSTFAQGKSIGTNGQPGRLSKQLSPLDKDIPIAVWRIKKRIIEKERLHTFEIEPLMRDIITIMLPGGRINPHKDSSLGEYIHSRFNVFLSIPPGSFNTFYGGNRVDAVEGHYTLCRSGIDTHWTDILSGHVPRITISFGFLIPRGILNKKYLMLPAPLEGQARPSALDIENHRTWIAITSLGGAWWYSGIYGKIINT